MAVNSACHIARKAEFVNTERYLPADSGTGSRLPPTDQQSRLSRLRRLRKLAEAALAQYDIPDAQVSFLQEADNLLYRVASPIQGQFLLRVHELPRHSESEIRSELLWLEALRRDAQLPVSEPMLNQTGSPVCEISIDGVPEPRRCVLLRWIPGHRKRVSLGTTAVKLMGAYTARLHQHAEQWTPPGDFMRPRWDWEHLAGASALIWRAGKNVYREDEMRIFFAAAQKIKANLEGLGNGSDVFGIIHSDLNPSNFVFRSGAAYAIDFEECRWSYYHTDIIVTLLELKEYGDRYEQLRNAFLDGYRHVHSLPQDYIQYEETFEMMRIVEKVQWILEWESSTFRPWGPNYLVFAVKALAKFLN